MSTFTCSVCPTKLTAQPPRAAGAERLERWFAELGWDCSTGRPLCPLHTAKPATVAGTLVLAEQRMLDSFIRGRFVLRPFGVCHKVEWQSSQGSRSDVERRALRVVAEMLAAAGYQADCMPELSCVRLRLTPEQMIGVDEPGIDHEHPVRVELATMAAE